MLTLYAIAALPAPVRITVGTLSDAETECVQELRFWDPDAETCYTTCPKEKPTKTGEQACRTCEELNASAPFWNPDTSECVAACPETSVGKLC